MSTPIHPRRRSSRVRATLLIALAILIGVFTTAGGPPAAVPTADVTIDSAVWSPGRNQLTASGSVSIGQPLGVFDGEGGFELVRLRIRNGMWRLRERNLSRAPCSLLAVSNGEIAQRTVTNAPADCGPPVNLPPNCSITPPPGPLDIGEPLIFTAVANDPEGRNLLFSWHFGGGIDQALSGEAQSGEPFEGVITFELGGQAFPISLTVADGGGATGFCETNVVVGSPPGTSRPPVDEQPPPGDPRQQQHALLAFNDLGMHCADLGSVPLSILPPFNVFNAQLFERGDPPRLMSSAEASMRYSASSNPTDPVVGDAANEPPSINSTSSNFPVGAQADQASIRKTDFWDLIDPSNPAGATVVEILFGLDVPRDEGLPTIHNVDGVGRRMPGILDPFVDNAPQPFSTFQTEFGWFKAEGTPITSVDDYGRQNAYPLMRVEATDSDGSVLAALDAVLPVSTEVDCRDCHVKGLVGADPDARASDLGFVESQTPGDRVDDEFAAKMNVLILHDFKHLVGNDGTDQYDPPLVDRGAVLCAVCHNSFALEEVTGGGLPGEPGLSSMSTAAHGFHGSLKITLSDEALVRDAAGEPVLDLNLEPGEGRLFPVDPLDLTVRMEQNCFKCHPGQITQCFRGAMFTAGLKCSSCHGDMLAVGGVFEGDFDHSGSSRARLPWRDEPRCESCHRGDAANPGEREMLTRIAYDVADPAAVALLAENSRFAENRSPNPISGGQDLALYRNSLDGHGGNGHDSAVACEGCHGSPHAIWGSNGLPGSNDNVASNQLQGHAGTLTECTVCHLENSFPDGTLDGPHGMHPVNDPNWIKSDGGWHAEFAEDWSNGDPCASCHGVHHLGTRLSKTPVTRQLRDAEGKLWATVGAGQEIGCNLCHDLEKSFD